MRKYLGMAVNFSRFQWSAWEYLTRFKNIIWGTLFILPPFSWLFYLFLFFTWSQREGLSLKHSWSKCISQRGFNRHLIVRWLDLRTIIIFTFGPHIINFVDKPFMFLKVPLHIFLRLLFEIIKFFFWNILPYLANLLHNIKSWNIRVIFDYFRTCLLNNECWASLTSLTKSI